MIHKYLINKYLLNIYSLTLNITLLLNRVNKLMKGLTPFTVNQQVYLT